SLGLQRRPAAADRVAHFTLASDAQERLLLPGEARRGSVLSRRRRPHRHRTAAQPAVRLDDLLLKRFGERVIRLAAVGGGGDAKPRRHRQPGLREQPEAQPFAANGVGIALGDLGKCANVGHGVGYLTSSSKQYTRVSEGVSFDTPAAIKIRRRSTPPSVREMTTGVAETFALGSFARRVRSRDQNGLPSSGLRQAMRPSVVATYRLRTVPNSPSSPTKAGPATAGPPIGCF